MDRLPVFEEPWYNGGGWIMELTERQVRLDRLIELLVAYQPSQGVFNQYRDAHPDLDRADGASLRVQNLRCYLDSFADARFILVGEAAGYAGCRFSGVPFTCEAQLVGPQSLSWTCDRALGRSSTAPGPWVERSATMVWEVLGERRDYLLWNAFPWHPFGAKGLLSNRHPGRDLPDGIKVLRCLFMLFPAARPYAVGRTAEQVLATLGLEAPYIRHPSHGGKRQFAAGVDSLTEIPDNPKRR
jgi:hypothetical protein